MSSRLTASSRVYVAGHNGLVGSAIVRRLQADGFSQLLLVPRADLDLRDSAATLRWFKSQRPEYVFMAAGVVGGIRANSRHEARFLYDNLSMAVNVIEAARAADVTKLLYLSSGCIYPREAAQPISEDALLTGSLEPTNEGYAIAKIAGLKLCEAYRRQYGCDFITAVPAGVYGPQDNFADGNAHVVASLIRRFHEAKTSGASDVVVWGTGRPRRQFIHTDDLADACLFLMRHYSGAMPVNVGPIEVVSIRELADLIREVVFPGARMVFDESYPDGAPARQLDISRIASLGWRPGIPLRSGLEATYSWYLQSCVGSAQT